MATAHDRDDDFESITEIRHRERCLDRLDMAERLRAIADRLEADSDPPPAEIENPADALVPMH